MQGSLVPIMSSNITIDISELVRVQLRNKKRLYGFKLLASRSLLYEADLEFRKYVLGRNGNGSKHMLPSVTQGTSSYFYEYIVFIEIFSWS